jgi:hypothetical protein
MRGRRYIHDLEVASVSVASSGDLVTTIEGSAIAPAGE